MKKILFVLLFISLPCYLFGASYYADEFMNIEWDAENSALGGADAVPDGKVYSLYYNPAGLAGINGQSVY